MNYISPRWERPRIPPVDPALIGSALFLVSEYAAELEAEESAIRDLAGPGGRQTGVQPMDAPGMVN